VVGYPLVSGRAGVLRTWLLVASLFALPSSARALDLQALAAGTRGRVAHLSIRDADDKESSSGSGFVISKAGRVVTNFHVIDGAERIVAVFPDEREVPVQGVWIADARVDLAVLQLAPGSYDTLELAQLPAREGEEIVVIGSPLGLSNAISTGIVGALRQDGFQQRGRAPSEDRMSWTMQISAAVSPGSSGSPILRGSGEVVGVVVGTVLGLDGMHFGIEVSELKSLLSQAPAAPRALASATGARSKRTNLILSGVLFGAVALLWVLVARLTKRRVA
jgi:S1-C subfamily serine protease